MTDEMLLALAVQCGARAHDDDDCEDGVRYEAGRDALLAFGKALLAKCAHLASMKGDDFAPQEFYQGYAEACREISDDILKGRWPYNDDANKPAA